MNGKSETTDERRANIRNCWRVLNAILASTITSETARIPSSERTLLNTFTEAVIKYIGSDNYSLQGEYTQYSKNRKGEIRHSEIAIYETLEEALSKSGEKLAPETREAIQGLTKPYWVNPDGPDHQYITCEVYELFRGRIVPGIRPVFCLDFTFSPAYDWVLHSKKVLAELPEAQRKDAEGIGKILREIWQRH